MKKYYMHTINGRPATYSAEGMVVYALRRINLVESLKVLRQQQKASQEWRDKQKYITNHPVYGYVQVYAPK